MRSEAIIALIETNQEIEFDYNGERYSITYYNDNREKYISFCKFNSKTTIDVKSPDEVLKIKIGELTLEKIFSNLPDSAFDIF